MRNIRGYICVARGYKDSIFPGSDILFGKPLDGEYARLESTGLTPYSSINEAQDLSERLDELYGFVRVGLLNMSVAENVVGARGLLGSSFVVVVGGTRAREVSLVGPYVKGRPDQRPLPGAKIEHNGIKTFGSIDEAVNTAEEISRQTQCHSPISTFRLNFIDST